ncbi:hypothetical protein QTN25_007026 [Entamoeba marina]
MSQKFTKSDVRAKISAVNDNLDSIEKTGDRVVFGIQVNDQIRCDIKEKQHVGYTTNTLDPNVPLVLRDPFLEDSGNSEKLAEENQKLRGEIEDLNKSITQMKFECKTVVKKNEQVTKLRKSLKEKEDTYRKEIKDLNDYRGKSLENEVDRISRELEETKNNINSTKTKLGEQQQEIEQLEESLKNENKISDDMRIDEIEKERDEFEKKIKELDEDYEKRKMEYEELNQSAAPTQDKSEGVTGESVVTNEKIEELKKEKDQLNEQISNTNKEIENLTEILTNKEKEITETKNAIEDLQNLSKNQEEISKLEPKYEEPQLSEGAPKLEEKKDIITNLTDEQKIKDKDNEKSNEAPKQLEEELEIDNINKKSDVEQKKILEEITVSSGTGEVKENIEGQFAKIKECLKVLVDGLENDRKVTNDNINKMVNLVGAYPPQQDNQTQITKEIEEVNEKIKKLKIVKEDLLQTQQREAENVKAIKEETSKREELEKEKKRSEEEFNQLQEEYNKLAEFKHSVEYKTKENERENLKEDIQIKKRKLEMDYRITGVEDLKGLELKTQSLKEDTEKLQSLEKEQLESMEELYNTLNLKDKDRNLKTVIESVKGTISDFNTLMNRKKELLNKVNGLEIPEEKIFIKVINTLIKMDEYGIGNEDRNSTTKEETK